MISDSRYDSLIHYYAEKNGFEGKEWLRLKAQIKAESAFDPKAVSAVGAKGLGQFMDPTWGDWGKGQDVFNPEANIDAQCRYMAWMLKRVTTWERAFAGYNWGIGRMLKLQGDSLWKAKLPFETDNYLIQIDKFYKEYINGNHGH